MNQPHFSTPRFAISGIAGLAGALLVSYGAPAHAQQSELDVLRQQILEMQAKLQKLEDAQAKTSTQMGTVTGPSVQAKTKTPIEISGLLQVRGDSFLSDDRSPAGASDSFRLRRGELRISVPKITDKISGTAMFDIAKTGTAASSLLQELSLTYQLMKGEKNSLYLDAGQFKIPFGYEGDLVSSSALPLVDRALYYRFNDPSGGRAGDIRDTGLQLRGTAGQFDYRLGVFNGLGERQNQTATSDNKAIVGRLIFKPTALEGSQFGISLARGNQRNTPIGTPAVNSSVERDLFNVFAVYKKDKFSAQTEYFKGDFLTLSVAPGASQDRKSYYGSLGYMFTKKLEGVARYDKFEANTALPNTDTKETSLGVNYYIKGNNAKLQANVVQVDAGAPGASADRTELRGQLQVAF